MHFQQIVDQESKTIGLRCKKRTENNCQTSGHCSKIVEESFLFCCFDAQKVVLERQANLDDQEW